MEACGGVVVGCRGGLVVCGGVWRWCSGVWRCVVVCGGGVVGCGGGVVVCGGGVVGCGEVCDVAGFERGECRGTPRVWTYFCMPPLRLRWDVNHKFHNI